MVRLFNNLPSAVQVQYNSFDKHVCTCSFSSAQLVLRPPSRDTSVCSLCYDVGISRPEENTASFIEQLHTLNLTTANFHGARHALTCLCFYQERGERREDCLVSGGEVQQQQQQQQECTCVAFFCKYNTLHTCSALRPVMVMFVCVCVRLAIVCIYRVHQHEICRVPS